jgi:hypothetical protein
VVTEPGYYSTSYERGANFGGDLQITLLSKTGKKIDFLSQFGGEKEVLFAPGLRIKILEVKDVGGVKQVMAQEL